MKTINFVGIFVIVFMFVGVTIVSSQDFSSIENDFSSLLREFGKELAPSVFQSSVCGSGMGEAELGEFPHFYFSTSGGAVFSHGIGNLLDNSNYELLNVSGIVDTFVSGTEGVGDILETLKTSLPYPNMRLSMGIGIIGGWEVQVLFALFPQAITNVVGDLSGISGLEFNALNTGVRVRKVLVSDYAGYPAISLGMGYSYSGINIGYTLPDIDQSGEGFSLTLSDSKLSVTEVVHSVGINFLISKKLFIFVPFIGLDSWYQFNSYSASIGGKASFSSDAGGDTKDFSAESLYDVRDLAILFSGGLEIKLGAFSLTSVVSFNPNNLVSSANTGLRIQF